MTALLDFPPGEGDVVKLRLLGSLDLQCDVHAKAREVLRQPKRLAILAYLAAGASNGFTRRDTLLGLFWPESDRHHARSSLRQALRFLRMRVGEDVLVTRGPEEIGVSRDHISCDAIRFEDLCARGEYADALEEYRGDLLEGFHSVDSQVWDDWLERRRNELRERAADAAWCLAEHSEKTSSPFQAAFWGKRALALSPFGEPQVQRLMRLLDRVGDRAGALRAFRGLTEWLKTEFEVEPSPETRELAGHISARTESSNGKAAALFAASGRRMTASDRRAKYNRRRVDLPFEGDDQRSGDDRRTHVDRRSGIDRRRSPE